MDSYQRRPQYHGGLPANTRHTVIPEGKLESRELGAKLSAYHGSVSTELGTTIARRTVSSQGTLQASSSTNKGVAAHRLWAMSPRNQTVGALRGT